MMLYLDTSALVKRYVSEAGSSDVSRAVSAANMVATVLITRAEVAAALTKAIRVGALTQSEAWAILQLFRNEWLDLVRVQVTELLTARADTLAWEHNLRGYDAVHLAAATMWQDGLGERVTMATYDQRLWAAAQNVGLDPYPVDLPDLLAGQRVR